MPNVVFVFDIDSTIADNDHRACLLREKCSVCLEERSSEECLNCGGTSFKITQDSWDSFLDVDRISKDKPIERAIRVLDRLRELGASICFLTGRHESQLGDVTRAWLRDNAGWQETSEPLYMRLKEDEGLPASVYKERAIKRVKEQTNDESTIYIFFEDDPHVFNVYNKHGITIRCPDAWDSFLPRGAFGHEPKMSR